MCRITYIADLWAGWVAVADETVKETWNDLVPSVVEVAQQNQQLFVRGLGWHGNKKSTIALISVAISLHTKVWVSPGTSSTDFSLLCMLLDG